MRLLKMVVDIFLSLFHRRTEEDLMFEGSLRIKTFMNAVKNTKYLQGAPIKYTQADCQDLVAWFCEEVLGWEDMTAETSLSFTIKVIQMNRKNNNLPLPQQIYNSWILPKTDVTVYFPNEEEFAGHTLPSVPFAIWFGKGDPVNNPNHRHVMVIYPRMPGSALIDVRDVNQPSWGCIDIGLNGTYFPDGVARIKYHTDALKAVPGNWFTCNDYGAQNTGSSGLPIVTAVPLLPPRRYLRD